MLSKDEKTLKTTLIKIEAHVRTRAGRTIATLCLFCTLDRTACYRAQEYKYLTKKAAQSKMLHPSKSLALWYDTVVSDQSNIRESPLSLISHFTLTLHTKIQINDQS